VVRIFIGLAIGAVLGLLVPSWTAVGNRKRKRTDRLCINTYHHNMKKISLFLLAGLFSLCAAGQDAFGIRPRHAAPSVLLDPIVDWDASRTYPQLVILIEYSDTVFSMPDPKTHYNRVLNEPGYNEGVGPGCAAEYLLAQSGGLFHVRFDVFGPFRVDLSAKHNTYPGNYGNNAKIAALDSLFAAFPDMDYNIYDWDGDNAIEQIVYICAGPGADQGHSYFVWPNTDNYPSFKKTPDGLSVAMHSITTEGTYASKYYSKWFGFGTLLHEYSHSLGLPDVYPTEGDNVNKFYSVADTWDLMDGGNLLNYGWCPPGYTAFEKMFLHWLTPVELKSDTTITDMLPVSEGGKAYLIRHTENEYLLLENRQQRGWDYAVPGRGLTVWHVAYDQEAWRTNNVNNEANLRLHLYHADNLTYKDWKKRLKTSQAYADMSVFIQSAWLSTSAYPWSTDTTDWVNDCLTETSVPALVMYNENSHGSKSLGKRITNIRMAPDGAVSFTLETSPDTPAGMENTAPYSLTDKAADKAADKAPVTKKYLLNGVLYILRGDRTYTLTGMEVQQNE